MLVHGWPESKRIYWRVIAPLVDAGFEVIVPDLRGFGDSEVGPSDDPFGDVATHSRDVHALVHDHLGHDRAVLVGGDLGGPVIQDLALRFPGFTDRLVLFNSPVPYLREAMEGMRTRPAIEAADYFLRQGTDADALAADLATPGERRRYIATFYGSRFWAHPGAFDPTAVEFHTEPFADAAKLRATFRTYESVFDPGRGASPPCSKRTPTCAASSSSARATTCSIPTSTAWPPSCSPITSGPSSCATAGTSCPGRHRTRWSRRRRCSGRTFSAEPVGLGYPSSSWRR